jgi:1-acyl-sn-glycerol-3-phosphate acyltransferase
MQLLRYLYTAWAAFWFIAIYVTLIFPIQFVCLQREAWKIWAHRANRLFGILFFGVIGVPIRVQYESRPDPNRAYVFCVNHFSYFDIPLTMMIVDNYFAFIGKSAVKKIPLFGYMFAKLHIQVDRNDRESRVKSLVRSTKALQSGRSIVIYPEGGILTKQAPQMHLPLKDGAFSMAIQQQVPVVPVTFLDNYLFLPDKKEILLHWRPLRVVIHRPIDTAGLTMTDLEALKQQTYETIQGELLQDTLAKATAQ